jgi:hypothetical protein
MEHLISPVIVANNIMMDTFEGTHLLVEGTNDRIVYSKFTPRDKVRLNVQFGFKAILDTLENLKQRGFERAIGIIDSDFRHIENDLPQYENVFVTDNHDLEMLAINSNAFDVVLDHRGSKQKINAIENGKGINILREILLDLAKPIGYLKFANRLNKLNLKFKADDQNGKPLKISQFISIDKLEFLGEDKMVEVVLNFCHTKTKGICDRTTALKFYSETIKTEYDLLQLCNGHDEITILSIALKKKWGSIKTTDGTPEDLEKDIILAYDSRCFEKTRLYASIKAWERKNNVEILSF